ncbi:Hypothetical protein CINCED_3A020750 [Cinara cedri]|nr:Hypothetical protein CINCED_3A020750 [Cinara cedri]
MRLVFVLCTTLAFIQIFGVSIAQSQTKGSENSNTQTKLKQVRETQSIKKPQTSPNSKLPSLPKDNKQNIQNPTRKTTVPSNEQQKPKTLARPQGSPNPEPAVPRITARGLDSKKKKQSDVNEQEIILSEEEIKDNDNSQELELPPENTIQSGKVLAKTVKRQANKGGSGFINNLTRFVNSTCNTFGFLIGIIRKQSSNTNTVVRYASDVLSRSGSSASNGVIGALKRTQKIGREGSKQFSKLLNNAEEFGVNLTKLGGTAASSTVGIGTKVAKVGNNVLLKSNKSMDRALNSITPKLPEDEDENETNSQE